MGLPVLRTKLLIYVTSGTLAGIAAAIIGGTLLTGGFGYALGSVVGALAGPDERANHPRRQHPPEATTITTGGILLTFVLLQRAVMARQQE